MFFLEKYQQYLKNNESVVNADVLDYVFGKSNAKKYAAYYINLELAQHLTDTVIHQAILTKLNYIANTSFTTFEEIISNNNPSIKDNLFSFLPKLKVIDPACGGGELLIAAFRTIFNIYYLIIGDNNLDNIKRQIISKNLYGVDIMPEAVEITKLRLCLEVNESKAINNISVGDSLLTDNDGRFDIVLANPPWKAFNKVPDNFIYQRGTINLYKLFLEKSFNLLADKGGCGIIIPSGIYTDLNCKPLRQLLFNRTTIRSLHCFENRKHMFKDVSDRFKFVVLTFSKSGNSDKFFTGFMLQNIKDITQNNLNISVDLIRKASPQALAVMEFKNNLEISIVEKMLKHPLLNDKLQLTRELDMTNDKYLFKEDFEENRLPLFEGRMINHFKCDCDKPRFWVNATEIKDYRLAFRAIAANTNYRTLIATILPPCYVGNSLIISECKDYKQLLLNTAFFNSFVVDWYLRLKVTTNINMFFIKELPIPQLNPTDNYYSEILNKSAKLICVSPEFNTLAKTLNISCVDISESEKYQIRVQLDAFIAHIYKLSKKELSYIISTFKITDSHKQDILQAFTENKYSQDGLFRGLWG